MKTSKAQIWWRATRYHFVSPSIFPAIIGSIVAWAQGYLFHPYLFTLVLVGVVVNHVALNMADDYFDFRHAVDQLKGSEKNPYTGGSGILTAGILRPVQFIQAFSVLFLVTIIIGLGLSYLRGYPILLLGIFGVFCSLFYTAPPLRLSHRGLGEFIMLLCFGPVIGLGAYFVQTAKFDLTALLATLPCGIMLLAMILVNEIPDQEQDRAAGKLTLVARFGAKPAIMINILSWVSNYLVIALGIALKLLPALTAVCFIFMLPTIHTIRLTLRFQNDPLKMMAANLATLRIFNLHCLALILVFSIKGLLENRSVVNLLTIISLFVISYLPAATPILRKTKSP
jgi:1,4-dihydroxy-2-naphthoate octaprenyltransferase